MPGSANSSSHPPHPHDSGATPEHDHDHDHGHGGHDHEHVDVSKTPASRLLQALVFSAIITLAQVIGGYLSHSLALLSDALHTLTDGVALMLSYGAMRLAQRRASEQFTFGFKRAETLAAVLNSGVLIGISLWLAVEAVGRLITAPPVTGGIMVGVASVSLVANIINSLLLARGAKENLNMRSAYLHVMSDGVVSLGVVAGGAVILYDEKLRWIDPLLTLLISAWLIYESGGIVWSATRVLMMSAPGDVRVREIAAAVAGLPGVRNFHHVHLWVLSDQSIHLEAHVDVEDCRVSETTPLVRQVEELLRERWGVTHVTLQFECGRCGEKPALLAKHAE